MQRRQAASPESRIDLGNCRPEGNLPSGTGKSYFSFE